MRKSFKKVLAAVLVASMAFSTPIVSNAGTGEGGAAQTVELNDVIANPVTDVVSASKASGFAVDRSDIYKATGDFDVTFTLTNITSDMAANWKAPVVFVNDATGTEVAAVRSDNYGWGSKYDAAKSNFSTPDKAEGEDDWAYYKSVLNNCNMQANLKRSGDDVALKMTFTNVITGKRWVQNYGLTLAAADSPSMSVQFTGENCTSKISNVVATENLGTLTVTGKMDLVMNGTKEATIKVEAKDKDNKDAAVTYETLDPAVATVDENGKVTAVANGTTRILTKGVGTAAETIVNVTTKPENVVISGLGVANGKLEVVVNKSQVPEEGTAPIAVQLTATVNPDTASKKDIVWASDNAAVVVSEDGVVQAKEDAADGAKAKITATVKDTTVKAELNVTVKVNEVDHLVAPGRIEIATPAAVTVSAGDKVPMSATVYGGGKDADMLAANQNVVWSAEVKRVVSGTAVTVSGAAVAVSVNGEVTVPSNVEDNDVLAVTATSKVAPEVKATKEIRVRNGEVLTGTAWWTGMQVSKDRIIDTDNPSVNFIVQPTDIDGFCVEIYSLEKNAKGAYVKHKKADIPGVDKDEDSKNGVEKGGYITFSYPGSFDGWMVGIPAWAKDPKSGAQVSIGSDDLYSISADKTNGFNVADTYQVTVTKSGKDIIMLIKDLTTNAWFWRAIAKDVDMDSDILGVHFMAQFGTFTLYDVNEDGSAIKALTTDKTDKPVTVTPGKRPTAAPTATPDNSTKATATPTPNNNNNTNNTTVGKTTLKKATITVKKGKKKVSKVTVKKGKKVTLKVSANSKGKISMAKLSKKAKKVASVTLKSGKLTIKGKKKGKVTIKLTAKKTSKYKAATKSVKVTVK